MKRLAYLLIGFTLSVIPCAALADALVVTRAMKASTIVEIFVEEKHVRVEIEVGIADLPAFRNGLPDELYQRLAGGKRPFDERWRTFIEQDWVLEAGADRLEARLEQMAPIKRLVRDEITGAPLVNQPSDAESVLQFKLSYPLPHQVETLTIRPPRDATGRTVANIGFVVYHLGVAVNDFRYLSRAETLQLDWSDPWYSRFASNTLLRRYASPAAAFLYVENFEVRKEIVFRPKDLQAWIDLGLDGSAVIGASQRDAVREKAATFLHEHSPLQIDGQVVPGTLDRVHFINRTLRTSGVVEPDLDIDINTALLGAIYVYPIEALPQHVVMQWDLFNQRIARVPTVASDEAGGLPSYLEPDDAKLVWTNYLTNPTRPGFLEVPPPPLPPRVAVPVGSIICLALVVAVWTRRLFRAPGKRTSPLPIIVGSVLLFGAATLGARSMTLDVRLPGTTPAPISDTDAGTVTHSLLRNLYHAFDYRDEGRVYDVLDRSVSGDLLTKIYLETRRSLTLASQGGALVKVKEVELVDCQTLPSTGDDSFSARCTWTVTGAVGHWGHIHQRTNQYHADFAVRAVDGQWKITDMEVLSEVRL